MLYHNANSLSTQYGGLVSHPGRGATYMPTLPDYPGVSRIRNESPGLPYGSPHLPDKGEFGFFLYIWLIF